MGVGGQGKEGLQISTSYLILTQLLVHINLTLLIFVTEISIFFNARCILLIICFNFLLLK